MPDRTEIDIELLPETRQSFEARVKQISRWLEPAGHDLAIREIGKLFAVMPSQNRSEDSSELALRVMCDDLSRLPYFALVEACRKFRTGQMEEKRWAPTVGEIHQAAVNEMTNLLRERKQISDVLQAKKIDKPNVDRAAVVAAAMGKLKGMGDAGKDAENVRTGHKAEATKRKEETEEERITRLKSPSLFSAKKLAASSDQCRTGKRPSEVSSASHHRTPLNQTPEVQGGQV